MFDFYISAARKWYGSNSDRAGEIRFLGCLTMGAHFTMMILRAIVLPAMGDDDLSAHVNYPIKIKRAVSMILHVFGKIFHGRL